MYRAAWYGHEACVAALIAAGADPNVVGDVYDEALVLDDESEQEHMDRVYIELTAMENAKEYFEKMAKF